MFDFLGKRLQKSIDKMKAKTSMSEADVLEVSRDIKLALLEADVNLLVVKDFIKVIKAKALQSEVIGKLNPSQHVIKIVKEELVKVLGGTTKGITLKSKLPVIMMVGLQGSGKTTSTVKLAKYLMKKKGYVKPLLIAADVYRPAAIDQLVILGKQLNIDVYSESTTIKPEVIVSNGLQKAQAAGYDLVLIDTAGRLAIDEKLMQELEIIKNAVQPDEIFFVVDALVGQDIINVAQTFHDRLVLSGSIITKLDSDARGGAALSITKLLKVPIVFIGTGEKISAIDLFHPDRMANRILGMGDVISLIEKAEEVVDANKSRKMMRRMMAGSFDLDDLMEQLEQVKKLGKFSKLLQMIPGANNKISSSQISSAEKKMQRYQILVSSMTKRERKYPKLLKVASRKARIINGSGRTNQEYNALINDFERMSKQMKNISKSIKDGSFNPGMMRGMNL